jgi:alkyl sulfatase BDS1-like metallo-beta-lactamase superfamily hydrolase
MAIFADNDQLYRFFNALISRIEADNAQAAESMLKSGMRFQFRFKEPQADVMIDARKRPLRIEFGHSSEKPDLEVALTADTLHQILSGKLTLRKAIGSRQIIPKGPVWKTTVLADLFTHAQQIYPELLQTFDITVS